MSNPTDDAAIRRFYEHVFEQASRIVKSGREHVPLMIVLSRSGSVSIMLTSQLTGDQRAALHMKIAEHQDVLAAVLIRESWYVDSGVDEEHKMLAMADQRPLHEHPDRKEAIVFDILTNSRQAVMICPINRADNTLANTTFEWMDEDFSKRLIGRYVRPTPRNKLN